MNTEILETTISPESVASRNLFTAATPTSTGDVTELETTLEVTVNFNDDDHARWQALVDDGMPANYAYALISDARTARHDENYLLTILNDADKPAASTFNATYGKGKAWKANHRVQAADYEQGYARVIHAKVRIIFDRK